MNPTILGVIGPGFLKQVPTLGFRGSETPFACKNRSSGAISILATPFRVSRPKPVKK